MLCLEKGYSVFIPFTLSHDEYIFCRIMYIREEVCMSRSEQNHFI